MVRAPDVADLPLVDEGVEGVEGLVHGGDAVPLVHLVQVDVVGLQAPETRLAGAQEVTTRQPGVVLALTHRIARLGAEDNLVTVSLDDLSNDLLGPAI